MKSTPNPNPAKAQFSSNSKTLEKMVELKIDLESIKAYLNYMKQSDGGCADILLDPKQVDKLLKRIT